MSKIGLKICQNNLSDALNSLLLSSELDSVKSLLAPHTKRAYLVGGCVRDALLGRTTYDYDIEVYDIEPEHFDMLMQSIGASGVGKSYFIYKFGAFDMGLPRTESKIGDRHTDFDVSYCNDERKASARRDFSVNAMMINIFDGSLLDFWGGQECLKQRTLRHIDDEKFCEDALRVLRGIQFAARLDFGISDDTLRLMQTLDLGHLSGSRISCELVKFFKADHLEVGLFYLHKLGLLKRFFGVNLSQNELKFLINELKNARKFIKDERLFLYILAGNFSANIHKIVQDLALPKSYLGVLKQPFFKAMPSMAQMMEIALLMPLNSWLGCYNQERIKLAKSLKIYKQKFAPLIDMDEILSLGLKGEDIGVELRRRKQTAVQNYLQELDLQD